MSTDTEEVLRRALTGGELSVQPIGTDEVIALGHRLRRRRRRRRAGLAFAGVCAALVLAAPFVVPATGSVLSPVVWAAGPVHAGIEGRPWMEANGHNFVLTIRDSYLGDRDTLIIAEREPNGDTRELMGEGPVRSEDLPLVGMRVSTHPTVVFALLPGGAQDIEAVATDGSKPTVSTTRISAPRGGAEFVAVAFGLAAAETDVANLTWTDPQGQRHNWPR